MKRLRLAYLGNPDAFKNNNLCQYFVERGHEVHFVCHWEPRNRVKGIEYHVLKAKFLRLPKAKLLEYTFAVKMVIKRIRPDILHANNVTTYGWLGAFSGFRPLVVQCFGGDIFDVKGGYYKWSTMHSLRKADKVIITGAHMAETLKRVFGVDSAKVEVVPRGIDLSVFRPYANRDEFVKNHKLKPGPIVFSPRYILDYVYNIDVIIKSVPIVKKAFPQVTYIQMLKDVEDQDLFESYRELIRRHNIEENILFHPLVDNREMAAFYNAADLCVSIPKFDGFPVSVLEGSACGTPFIVSDVPYTKEWFENGKSGIVLKDVSPEALAEATIELLKDERRRRQMGRMSMEKVRAGVDYYQCMGNLEKIYFKLVGSDA